MTVIRTFVSVLVFATIATLGFAEDKKLAVDPSGTWRWDFEFNGDTIKNVLKLNTTPNGKVTGTLSARERSMEVTEGQITDGKLSFLVKAETPRAFTLAFKGKVDGDKVDGEASAKTDEGSREFPWTAKRSVESSDVVGAWKLKITLPSDQILQPLLTVALKDQKLTASYLSDDGKTIEAKQLEIKDNQLQFEIDTEHDSAKLHVAFKGRPYGSKIMGKLKYTVNSDSGELDYTGSLQPDKK